jgi:fumarate reductase flavoprotein subunit
MARVLDQSNRPIPGLYAGGGAAMGISGRSGGRGYMSGNGLLSALGLGLIAGRSAAQDLCAARGPVRSDRTNQHAYQLQHGGS